MVQKPWVTAEEVKAYTEYPLVKKRDDHKLQTDISRAERYIMAFTNNKFQDIETLPAEIKTATLLIAEAYAFNACISANDKKSETFDDYSYTIDKNTIDIEALDIYPLLEEFIVPKSKSNISMKLRKL